MNVYEEMYFSRGELFTTRAILICRLALRCRERQPCGVIRVSLFVKTMGTRIRGASCVYTEVERPANLRLINLRCNINDRTKGN